MLICLRVRLETTKHLSAEHRNVISDKIVSKMEINNFLTVVTLSFKFLFTCTQVGIISFLHVSPKVTESGVLLVYASVCVSQRRTAEAAQPLARRMLGSNIRFHDCREDLRFGKRSGLMFSLLWPLGGTIDLS